MLYEEGKRLKEADGRAARDFGLLLDLLRDSLKGPSDFDVQNAGCSQGHELEP